MIPSWLMSKAAGPIATSVAVGLALAMVVMSLTNHFNTKNLNTRIASLEQELSTAKTNLAQARTNVASLEISLEKQNAAVLAMAKQADESQALYEKTKSARAALQKIANAQAADLLAFKPTGDTVCQRMIEVDDLFLETLKQ